MLSKNSRMLNISQLTQVPNVSPMKKLKSLYLFENSIETLTKEDLSENLELEVIWLYHNKLKYIEASAFEQLPKLRVVDLTHNRCIDMKRNQNDQLPFYNAINEKCSERPVEENEIETLARSELF
ncbi:CLUMA_CG013530, isoform A [Clunio marinus]|uniref:CLUMA_CG013527, isoform A n=1 Tax=Clunio marinus TaxID=568069 RepID=A0A1J1IP42_9DIPT|nr:CLUMA_CG013527, isoform A [Clunio marinus]CRL00257.1 CLUMA_CG013530, isoform A [Clunio marinus]